MAVSPCHSGAEAVIDLKALRHNLKRVRTAAPESKIMAVVKANAYGHGLLEVANALQNVDALAVARLAEGVTLRNHGVRCPIVQLEGPTSVAELEVYSRDRLTAVVHSLYQFDLLDAAPPMPPFDAWLKVDTGMHRIGIRLEQASQLHRRLAAHKLIKPDVSVMTHFACADDRDSPRTQEQINAFSQLTISGAAGWSMANSAGLLAWPHSRLDWVRPGIMLYGVSPFEDNTGADWDLHPVMTLSSRLIAINRVRAGESVGYGADWRCPEDMDIGVVAIGYGDGYPRHAAVGTPVLLRGQRVPLVGRVSMDMITVDLRTLPNARVGDEAVLWGNGLPVEQVARYAGTISYELLCKVTSRVAFHYAS